MWRRSPFIRLYSKPGCGVCQVVQRYLDQQGARYQLFDVSRNETALQEMVTATGGRVTLPVTVMGEHVVTGYDKGALDALLKQN